MRTAEQLNELSGSIIGAAIEVHRELGPGLLESTYADCLAWERRQSGLSVEREKAIPLRYKTLSLEGAYRPDLLVDNAVVVEVKATEGLLPVHSAQILTYLKLTNCALGLLMNFNVDVMRNGIKRVVHGF